MILSWTDAARRPNFIDKLDHVALLDMNRWDATVEGHAAAIDPRLDGNTPSEGVNVNDPVDYGAFYSAETVVHACPRPLWTPPLGESAEPPQVVYLLTNRNGQQTVHVVLAHWCGVLNDNGDTIQSFMRST